MSATDLAPYGKIHLEKVDDPKKKKVLRNFGRIDEHFWGKNGERFLETPLKKMLRPILMSATDLGYGKNCVLKPGKGR